ncbi:hypothetical protein ONZ45_g2674 [Pleurotus djamor]|nr:hypothetical protein ONZ45_g2674 [Pleurotus djamor]
MSNICHFRRLNQDAECATQHTGSDLKVGSLEGDSRRRPSNHHIHHDGSTKKVTSRGKGKLRYLPHLPLEILFEIFGFLTPLDVLRLARTNKDLRSVLMKRSAITPWKTVFKNVPDTPSKPETVSEPAWANFLFTNTCYQCLSPRPPFTFAAHQLRYCKRAYFDPESTYDFQQAMHEWRLKPSSFRMESIAFEYKFPLSSKAYKLTTVWLRAEFNEFKKGYAEVHHDPAKRKDFLDKRCEHFAELARIELAYTAWALKKQNALEAEIQDIRRGRLKKIKQKLSEAGWASDLETLSYSHREAFLQLPSVKEARPLTDQMWNKIKPEIFSLLEKFRAERLSKERSENIELRCRMLARLVKKYALAHTPDEILPSAADLYFLPSLASFKARLEEDAGEVAYSASHFDHILTEMPRYCEEWKRLCMAQILDVANSDPSARAADPPMTYNEGSLHLARAAFRQGPQSCADDRIKTDEAMRHLNSIPWTQLSASGFRLLPPDLTGAVVRACGFNPDFATSDDLNAQRIWLVGDRLAKDGHPTQVMGWKKALHLSCWNKYLGYTDSYTWTRVTDESLLETYNVAELDFYKTTQLIFPVICGRCSQQIPVATLLQHFKAHTDEALKMSDFRVHLDASPSQLFSLKIKREVEKANSL